MTHGSKFCVVFVASLWTDGQSTCLLANYFTNDASLYTVLLHYSDFSPPAILRAVPITLDYVVRFFKCGETVLPRVIIARRLKIFLEDDLERHFPKDRWVKLVAHPTRLPPHVAPNPEESRASPAAAGMEARVDDALPEPGLRFSQVEPPKGDILCVERVFGGESQVQFKPITIAERVGIALWC